MNIRRKIVRPSRPHPHADTENKNKDRSTDKNTGCSPTPTQAVPYDPTLYARMSRVEENVHKMQGDMKILRQYFGNDLWTGGDRVARKVIPFKSCRGKDEGERDIERIVEKVASVRSSQSVMSTGGDSVGARDKLRENRSKMDRERMRGRNSMAFPTIPSISPHPTTRPTANTASPAPRPYKADTIFETSHTDSTDKTILPPVSARKKSSKKDKGGRGKINGLRKNFVNRHCLDIEGVLQSNLEMSNILKREYYRLREKEHYMHYLPAYCHGGEERENCGDEERDSARERKGGLPPIVHRLYSCGYRLTPPRKPHPYS